MKANYSNKNVLSKMKLGGKYTITPAYDISKFNDIDYKYCTEQDNKIKLVEIKFRYPVFFVDVSGYMQEVANHNYFAYKIKYIDNLKRTNYKYYISVYNNKTKSNATIILFSSEIIEIND